jgi:ankyrin repeat protein
MKKLTLCIRLPLSMICVMSSSALAGPLHEAARTGDINEVERLIADGAKVNARDKLGARPLHLPAYRGHQAVAKLLIANGAKVNARDKQGRTPLYWAELGDHMDIVELLERHGGIVYDRVTEPVVPDPIVDIPSILPPVP